MNRRGRALVLALSMSIVLFAAIGGFMSGAMAAVGKPGATSTSVSSKTSSR